LKSPDDNYRKALQYAFLLLRYRDRSEREIFERLTKKGFTEEAGRKAGSYLKEKGFINDARYAENLKRIAVEHKYLGRRGVIHYLLLKGIPDEIVEGISGTDEEYLGAAEKLVEKQMRQLKGLDNSIIRKRLWGALLRKGFSSDIIKKALRAYFSDDEDEF
jgi:regulatory protein